MAADFERLVKGMFDKAVEVLADLQRAQDDRDHALRLEQLELEREKLDLERDRLSLEAHRERERAGVVTSADQRGLNDALEADKQRRRP